MYPPKKSDSEMATTRDRHNSGFATNRHNSICKIKLPWKKIIQNASLCQLSGPMLHKAMLWYVPQIRVENFFSNEVLASLLFHASR